ncbi:MAG: flagellar hook assembly protein FlgD [Alphaproteobacteria bacterium]
MSYIDKIVSYPSNTVLVENNIGEFRYEIMDPTSSATMQIRDSSNNVVHSEPLKAKQGAGAFMWKKPENLPDGIYSFSINAETVDGNIAAVKTYGSGRVSGIVSQEGKQKFEVNGNIVPLEDISKISNSTLGGKVLSSI